MKRIVWLALVVMLIGGAWTQQVAAQDGCAAAFDDVRAFTADVYDRMMVSDDGTIVWADTDWENVVRRMVASGEFYLNNCTDSERTLADQPEEIAEFAALSMLEPPVATLNVGGDFGEVALAGDFSPEAVLLDLNGDGVEELVLHTQVPYFSQATVYQVRGALSIAFFLSDDGWQGQVIAPVTSFMTDETGDHVSFSMVEDSTLSVDTASDALMYFPAPAVDVLDVEGAQAPLTLITLFAATGTGEAKELTIVSWDGRIPSVELRVAFDDWCYPGRALDWEIRADGSVFVPSNGNEEGSPLHCGRTPEALFQWDGERYVMQP